MEPHGGDAVDMSGPSMDGDVAIVGNGIAAFAAGIWAAQSDLSACVYLLNRRRKSDFVIALHPGAETVLDMLGVASAARGTALARPLGSWSVTASKVSFEPYGTDEYGSWRGLVIEEPRLVDVLKTRFRDLGGRVVRCAGLPEAWVEDECMRGLNFGGTRRRVRQVVDASGDRGIIARQLGLRWLYGSPTLLALHGRRSSNREDEAPEFAPSAQGWTWRVRTKLGEESWVSLSLAPADASVTARACDVTWRHLPRAAIPGCAIVGDAALRLDPGVGNGALRALLSAIKAIDLVEEHRDPIGYSNWIKAWARADGRELAERYSAAPFQVDWAMRHRWDKVALSS